MTIVSILLEAIADCRRCSCSAPKRPNALPRSPGSGNVELTIRISSDDETDVFFRRRFRQHTKYDPGATPFDSSPDDTRHRLNDRARLFKGGLPLVLENRDGLCISAHSSGQKPAVIAPEFWFKYCGLLQKLDHFFRLDRSDISEWTTTKMCRRG